MRYKKLFEPIFHTEVFVITGDRNRCNKKIKKQFDCDEDVIGEEYALTNKLKQVDSGRVFFVMYFSEGALKDKKNAVNTVAHECQHVTIMTLDECGVLCDAQNHETYCYLLGWLVSEVDLFLKKR